MKYTEKEKREMVVFANWIAENYTANGRVGCWDSNELNKKGESEKLIDSTEALLEDFIFQTKRDIHYNEADFQNCYITSKDKKLGITSNVFGANGMGQLSDDKNRWIMFHKCIADDIVAITQQNLIVVKVDNLR